MVVDLSAKFLGMELKNPFVPSGTPLTKSVGMARQLEDFGASALIMHPIFQEETADPHQRVKPSGFFEQFLGSEENNPRAKGDHYVELIHQMKGSMDIPIYGDFSL